MNFAEYIAEGQNDPKVEKLIKKFKKLDTEDYQKRGGNYPSSGVPDSINVGGYKKEFWIQATFKNTSEREALSWLKSELGSAGKQFSISAHQDGDYRDDWVVARAQKKF